MSARRHGSAPIHTWVAGRLDDEVLRAIERVARSDDVVHVAVMPDVHLATEVCVGTAFATDALVYLDAIGGDIGCGMAAIALDGSIAALTASGAGRQLLRGLRLVVPIQHHRADAMGGANAALLPDPALLTTVELRTLAERDGVIQLGTLGTGNHFLEIQHDQQGVPWLMVHSGSRGMGQAIRAAHRDGAERAGTGMRFLRAGSPAGEAYLADMQWARAYAAASRRCMVIAASELLRAVLGWTPRDESFFDTDHNHIAREEHLGGDLLVHRKGAMPAFAGEAGIVPGSMASASFHVTGRGVPEGLCSSAHGAGRAMSRSEARRRITPDALRRQMAGVHLDPRALAGLREEAPAAYKDIDEVMKAQRRLVSVTRVLAPVLSYKGAASARNQRRR